MRTDDAYQGGLLVRAGTASLTLRSNCQDHARCLVTRHGVVMAVADGVSGRRRTIDDRPSRTEVGAVLSVEIAVLAAARELAEASRDGSTPDVAGVVACALEHALAPLGMEMGRAQAHTMPATLLISVLTPTFCATWTCGDGGFGWILPPDATPTYQRDATPNVHEEGTRWTWSRSTPTLSNLAALEACRGRGVRRLLDLAFLAPGSAAAAYLATDSVEYEPTIRFGLESPVRRPGELATTLRYPALTGAESVERALEFVRSREYFDDVAVAHVATRMAVLGVESDVLERCARACADVLAAESAVRADPQAGGGAPAPLTSTSRDDRGTGGAP